GRAGAGAQGQYGAGLRTSAARQSLSGLRPRTAPLFLLCTALSGGSSCPVWSLLCRAAPAPRGSCCAVPLLLRAVPAALCRPLRAAPAALRDVGAATPPRLARKARPGGLL